VMNSYPSDSTFLMNKYIRLGQLFNLRLLVWGKKTRTKEPVYFGLHDNSLGSLIPELFHMAFTILLRPLPSRSFIKEFGLRKFMAGHYLIREEYDLIHFEFGTIAAQWIGIKKFIRAKVVVSFRGYDLNYYKLNKPGAFNEVWTSGDAFHFLGQDLYRRALLRNYNGLKPEYFISPAIDIGLFTPSDQKKQYKPGVLEIVSVGRVVWKKGYEYALKAISLMKKKNLSIRYTIIGSGENMQAVQFCIHELGLSDCVILAGTLSPNETRKVLDSSHIFLHAAVSEGFCNAVVEAQAMGLPVVCTKADGLAENIEEGITGFAVDIYDAQALAVKMEKLYSDPDLRSTMGMAGKARAEKLYRIEDQIVKFESMYNEVLEVPNKSGD
jgi:colanic acid/amylovoran biosynthesis glycosyltransferase